MQLNFLEENLETLSQNQASQQGSGTQRWGIDLAEFWFSLPWAVRLMEELRKVNWNQLKNIKVIIPLS